MPVRKPAVAGAFYPSDPKELSALVKDCFTHPVGPGKAPPAPRGSAPLVSVVSPHAGYVYSGPVAAHSYLHASSLPDPELLVVVAPNHYGIGSGISTFKDGEWETPLGSLRVDSDSTRRLANEYEEVEFDPSSQSSEHSLEVQLPFLRARRPDVRIVAITLGGLHRDDCLALGKAIAGVVRGRDDVLLCASSDMSHYIPADVAAQRDRLALDRMTALDPAGLFDVVEEHDISMCGFIPATIMLAAAVALGAKRAEVVRYTNSGEVSGDMDAVVGYAGVVVR